MAVTLAKFFMEDDETTFKEYPIQGLVPAVLARAFKLDEASIFVLSDESVFSKVENSLFDPPLSLTAKQFSISANPLSNPPSIISSEPVNKAAIAEKSSPQVITLAETKREINRIIKETCDIRQSVRLLSSGPQICLLLDSVQALLACTSDLTLEIDTSAYDCLKKSTTLKVTIMRCVNEINDTFFGCGLAMSKMKKLISTLPDDFTRVILALANPENPNLQLILELSCENISESSYGLVEECENITSKIEHAQKHLTQVIEIASETYQVHQNKKDVSKKLKEECREKKAGLEKINNLGTNQFHYQQRHRDVAYKNYRIQLDKYQQPSTFEIAFRATGNALAEINSAVASVVNGSTQAAKNVFTFAQNFSQTAEARDVSEKSLITLVTKIRNEGLEDLQKLDDNITQYSTFLAVHLRYKTKSKAGAEIKNLAKNIEKFFNTLVADAATIKPSELLQQEVLKKELEVLKADIDVTLNIVNETKKIQNDRAAIQEQMNEHLRLMKEKRQQDWDSAKKYALELSKETYEKENEKLEAIRQKCNDDQENIMNLAAKMATLDLEAVDIKDVIKFLEDAKNTLLLIHSSWNLILQFFKTVKLNIDQEFRKNLTKLLKYKGYYLEYENRELLPMMVKTMMSAVASCIQFGHCAEIYAEISTDYVMPIINNVGNSISISKDDAKICQRALQPKLKNIEEKVRKLIENRIKLNEDSEIPQLLESFARDCYQSLSIKHEDGNIDFDTNSSSSQQAQSIFKKLLFYLKYS